MKQFLIQSLNRLLGYGLAAAGAWVGARYGEGAGTCVGIAGGIVLNKVRQNILPRPSSEDVTAVTGRR